MRRPKHRAERAVKLKGSTPKPGQESRSKAATSPQSNPRKWLFRLTAVLLIPLAVIGAAEVGLRIAGYGYTTSFFLKRVRNGKTVCVENQKFGLRFFPSALARSPSPLIFPAEKPTNTYRIFILGESAALGDPDPAYGVGRYLAVMLNDRYPQTRFEVIPAAMTAINSHAMLPIARECARHEGDLWLIYAGNNEMEGPFGAATVFGPQAPPLSVIRATLVLKRTRLGQFFDQLRQRWSARSGSGQGWRGMGMFLGHQLPPEDPGRARVYAHFEKNLNDVIRAGRKAGVKVLLSTVPSNLKDSPPFASIHSPKLDATQTKEWEQAYKQAQELETLGELSDAAEKYAYAGKLDPDFAEAAFREGRCWLALTNRPRAQLSFSRARDMDALPFRADSRINDIIRAVATRNKEVHLVNGMEALASAAPSGIPGEDSFYEHVHLNFDGNYRLALAFAEEVGRSLPSTLTNQAHTGWASSEECSRRLALTDWNRYRAYEAMLGRISDAPFTNQLDSVPRQQRYRRKLGEIRSRLNPAAAKEVRAVYASAIAEEESDFFLHRKFGEFLEMTGDVKSAVAEWQRVRELLPEHPLAYFQVGRLFAHAGKNKEALEWLTQAASMRPDFMEPLDELGQVLAREKRFDESFARFQQAIRLQPESAVLYFHLANAQGAAGKRSQAIGSLHESIRLQPNYWEARYLLGVELARDEKILEAAAEFEEVVRLRPDYSLGHLNLGVAFARQGRLKEAFAQYQETLRLDPKNKSAKDHLEALQALTLKQP